MFPATEDLCASDDVNIIVTRDRGKLVRVKAMPPRNSENINNCPLSPLLAIAHGGNIDVQYVHAHMVLQSIVLHTVQRLIVQTCKHLRTCS